MCQQCAMREEQDQLFMDRNESKLVLVVEDNEFHRELTKAVLTEQKYRVTTAKDGREALDKFEEDKPDCVVLYLEMPGMGGIDVMERIRAKDGRIPIVIYTAYEDSGNFRNMAADAYIMKGKDKELGEAIRKAIEVRKLPRRI